MSSNAKQLAHSLRKQTKDTATWKEVYDAIKHVHHTKLTEMANSVFSSASLETISAALEEAYAQHETETEKARAIYVTIPPTKPKSGRNR